MIRVVLVDDHDMVRAGLREVLEREGDITIVGEAGSVSDGIAVIRHHQPTVAVVDLSLVDGSGLTVCAAVNSEHSQVGLLVLTAFGDEEAILEAAELGVKAYVTKSARPGELIAAIRKVADGQNLIDSAMVRQATKRLESTRGDHLDSLTKREVTVVALIARGYSNREIANELYLAEKTVKNYVTNLLAKLGLSRRTEVASLVTRRNEQRRLRGEPPFGYDVPVSPGQTPKRGS